jgi:protein dithiol oxidoreductase (disulfide-forming)
MKRFALSVAVLLLASLDASAAGQAPSAAPAKPATATGNPAAANWVEGRNYYLIQPPRPTGLPAGKVEVTEVFSYACPACNQFQPYMRNLKKSLPANAVLDYVPASFNQAEDWPMFQLAYETALALGVADQCHDAMFDAVWTTSELATTDASGGLKSHMPTIEDAARFYQKCARVPAAKFVATSTSFGVDKQVRVDEEKLKQYQIDRTPTLIVNGKYRVITQSAGGEQQAIDLVGWLVAKESK